jgi:hypothetical protein
MSAYVKYRGYSIQYCKRELHTLREKASQPQVPSKKRCCRTTNTNTVVTMNSATWGASSATPQFAAWGANAKSQLEQAVRNISEDEKASYLEAVRVAPHLVETESDPIRFLRVDNWDPSKAASRLCMYWKERTQIFGERAFLSLRDCSGSGALDEAAVKILEKGAAVQLPDDAKGSPVFLSDPSRVEDGLEATGMVRLQVMFYVLDKIAESNTMSQTRGVILLRIVAEAAFESTELGEVVMIMEQALPFKIKILRILVVPRPGTALPVHHKVYSEVWGDRTKFHVAVSAAELMRKLKTKGLRKSGLPLSCGGTWKYDKSETEVTSSPEKAYSQVTTSAETAWRGSSSDQNHWTDEQERTLVHAVSTCVVGDWAAIGALVQEGRSGVACREKWEIMMGKWSPQEDLELVLAIKACGKGNWKKVATMVPKRTIRQSRCRWMTIMPDASRQPTSQLSGTDEIDTTLTQPWTDEETKGLVYAVKIYGEWGKWATIAAMIPSRSEAECRLKWTSTTPVWTPQEDILLAAAVKGCDKGVWLKVAARVPGRTMMDCLNRWTILVERAPWISTERLPRMSEGATNPVCAVETFGGESEATIAAITTTTTTERIKTNSVVSRVYVVGDDYFKSVAAAADVPTYEESIPAKPARSNATTTTTNRRMSGTSLHKAATRTYPWSEAASGTVGTSSPPQDADTPEAKRPRLEAPLHANTEEAATNITSPDAGMVMLPPLKAGRMTATPPNASRASSLKAVLETEIRVVKPIIQMKRNSGKEIRGEEEWAAIAATGSAQTPIGMLWRTRCGWYPSMDQQTTGLPGTCISTFPLLNMPRKTNTVDYLSRAFHQKPATMPERAAVAVMAPAHTNFGMHWRIHGRSEWYHGRRTGFWTPEEDNRLKDAVETHKGKDWEAISALVLGRTYVQCWNRWHDELNPSIDRTAPRKGRLATDENSKLEDAAPPNGHWTAEEDKKLKEAVEIHKGKEWEAFTALIPGRTNRQCWNRWHELDPNMNRLARRNGRWTAAEDTQLTDAVQKSDGKNWAAVAELVPGRTGRQCGNRWNDSLRSPIIDHTVSRKD